MQYDRGKHCVFHHRYHVVWSTKYCYRVLRGPLRLRVRDICRQACGENGVEIIRGALSRDHVHMFLSGTAQARHFGPGAQDEGVLVLQDPARISRDPQALLGLPLLGQGVFFNTRRRHYRGPSTSVLRKTYPSS